MEQLKRGDKGDAVRDLQKRLKALDFDPGALDGSFGSKTEAALRAFQVSRGLPPDGVASAEVLIQLSKGVRESSLLERCLALTGTIETGLAAPACFGRVTGNFDGQGLSFGALQWNFGQGTLQKILQNLMTAHPGLMERIFGSELFVLRPLLQESSGAEAVKFFGELQSKSNLERWKSWVKKFSELGETPECISEQVKAAGEIYQKALRYCREYGLLSERGVALMFDVVVQNGSINSATRARILESFKGAKSEEERLLIIAHYRAEAALPQWREDVRLRKVCIALGSGKVHGHRFDIEREFGIGLKAAVELAPSEAAA